MRRQLGMRWGTMLTLGAAVTMIGGATRAQGQGSGATTVARTLVYHEITAVLTKGRSTATVSAQVITPHPFLRVGSMVLFKGLQDPDIGAPVLLDDGSHGDARAGDNLFTDNALGMDCCAEIGPRTARIKAEARAADGKRHATAVDLEPFAVLDTAP